MTFKGDEDYSLAETATGSGSLDEISPRRDDGSIVIDNGPIKLSVKDGSNDLFDTFAWGDKAFSKSQFVGPYVTIGGERLGTCFDEWKLVKEGPLFAVLQGKGRCTGSKKLY